MHHQENKYAFLHSNDNQIVVYSDNYYKKLLAYCQHYLNSYIQFLVPPQESCCEHLRRLQGFYGTDDEFYEDTGLDFLTKPDLERNVIPKSPFGLTTPTKICRFAEATEIPPSYEEIVSVKDEVADDVRDEAIDEVDSVVYLPEPFRTPRDDQFFPSSPTDQPSTVIFMPETVRSIDGESQIKAEKPPIARPKYTTQVSTISVKSNTVSLYSCWPPPIGIILISLLEVILFFANQKRPTAERHSHGDIADALMFDPQRRMEAWRFLTYLFVHIGYQHLLFNLSVQVFLGVILEMVHQRWRVLTIYFAGILAGSLGTSVFNPRVKLAGASGGVYSLITAHIVTVILKWKEMQYPPIQILAFLIVITTDFATGIYSSYQSKMDDVSYIAHGCGALAGLLVGFPVLRKLSPDKKTRGVQYVGLVIFLLLTLAAVIWNIAATTSFPKQLV